VIDLRVSELKAQNISTVQKAIEEGILTSDNYRDAISATRDDPQIKEYLESVFTQDDASDEPEAMPAPAPEEVTTPTPTSFPEVPTEPEVPQMSINEANRKALDRTIDLTDPAMSDINDMAQKNMDQTYALAVTRFSPEQIAQWQDNPIGFTEAGRFIEAKDVVPGGGVVSAYKSGKIVLIGQKLKNQEPLTESEETYFNEFIDKQLEMQIRGFSWGGGMAYYGSQMPAFMVEFAMTGGMGKSAQQAAQYSITKGAMVSAQKAALARYTGYAANIAARTATMVPANMRNYGDLRLGQYVELTQDGYAILADSAEKPYLTALKAFAYTSSEVASELMGAKINKYLVDPVTKRIKVKAVANIDKIPPKLMNGLIKAYRKLKPNAKIQDIMSKVGWHGMLNELGEERVAAVMNTYVDFAFGEQMSVDQIWDRIVPDKDQFLLEAGLITTMGGAKTGLTALANIKRNEGYSEEEIQELLEGLSNEDVENALNEELNVEENAPVKTVVNEDKASDAKLELEEEAANEGLTIFEQQQLAQAKEEERVKVSVKERILQRYDEDPDKLLKDKRDDEVKKLRKEAGEKRKKAKRIIDFIAEGGPLDPEQLMYYGLDPANVYRYDQNGMYLGTLRSPQGKGLKRVWSVKNPTQTISDITERYNEEMNLFNMNRALTDSEVAELIIEAIERGNLGMLMDSEAQLEIDMLERDADEIERLEDEELQKYYDDTYIEVAEYNDAEVPLETEGSLEGQDIEYAETIDEATFNQEVQEYGDWLDSQISEETSRMYDMDDGNLLDEFVDQPELVDDAPPVVDHTQSLFASFYANFVNKFNAVEKAMKLAKSRGAKILDGANTELLISSYHGIIGNIKTTLQRNTFKIDENGNMVKTGIGLKPILEAFDNLLFAKEPNKAQRKKDLIRYMIARRVQQDLQNYTIPGTADTDVDVDVEAKPKTQKDLRESANQFVEDFRERVGDRASQSDIDVSEDGKIEFRLSGKFEQSDIDAIQEFADTVGVPVTLGFDAATIDGKSITDSGLDAAARLTPKGELLDFVDVQPKPDMVGPAPEVVGPTQPAFARDKKFVGPVTERKVTEEQAMQAEIDLADLAMKYGDSMELFDTTANELYDYQKRVLSLMVQSGNMSQEDYDQIIKDNPNYIPFQRVMIDDFLNKKGFDRDQIAEVLDVLGDDEVQNIIDEGKISQAQYDKVIAANPEATKLLDSLRTPSKGGKGLFSGAASQAVVKRLRGSDLAIKDPINSIIANTSRIIDISSRNRIARSLINLNSFIPEHIRRIPQSELMMKVEVDGKETFVPSGRVPEGAVEVYVDGKKQFYEVSAPILKAMQNMRVEQLSFGEKMFRVISTLPSTVFRLSATMTPDFVLRNTFRDQFNAAIMTKARATPIDMVKGLASLIGDGELYNDWRASGGSMGTYMDLSDTGLVDGYKDLMDEQKYTMKMLRSFGLKPFADFSNAMEQATRVGIYNAAKRKGMSDLQAAQESRQGTADFMRSGYIGQKLNRYIPFLNAAIQGTDKMIRVFKESPKQAGLVATMTITLPSVLITGYYMYEAPDDEREEYLDIPQWVKDTHWVYKVGDEWVRVPKPFAMGYIFGSVPEKFLSWSHQNNNPGGKTIYQEIAKGVLTSTSPVSDFGGLLPPTIKTGLELTTNYDWFRRMDIYPEYMDDFEPELRATPYTSETARALGEKFNISPVKVDFALRGTFASTSKYITGAGDLILNQIREFNGQEYSARPSSNLDVPILGSFLVRSPRSGNSITGSTFYDLAQEVKIKTNSVKSFKGQKLRDYKKKNEFLFSQAGQIKRASKKIAKLNKQRRQVRADMRMSSEEKAKRLEQLNEQVYRAAERSVENYLRAMEKYESRK
jgi:hypothetical protein